MRVKLQTFYGLPSPVDFSAPDYLRQHTQYLKEEPFQIGDYKVWDYSIPSQGFGSVIMIERDDGIIVVGTTSHDMGTKKRPNVCFAKSH